MSKEKDFIKKISSLIQAKATKEGIVPSLVIAQCILESGWGQSELAKKYNNYFGINHYHEKFMEKYDYVRMTVPQEVNGKWLAFNEDMAKFNSLDECIDCLMAWYNPKNRPKYEKLHSAKNYTEACKYIRECGYATDSKYTDKLINIIEKYDLMKYDKKAETKKETYLYRVVCGSYEIENNAKKQVELLKKKGFDCFIDKIKK